MTDLDTLSLDANTAADASLLALVDRLAALLAGSDLLELEVEAGATALILRTPAALAPATVAVVAPGPPDRRDPAVPAAHGAAGAPGAATPASAGPSTASTATSPSPGSASVPAAQDRAAHAGRLVVAAPLTGVWYSSSSPGTPPFVAVGSEIAVGHVIGLIEAMKLFNEIKSDRAGRVARIVPENGALVRAKQPLIEVEP